MADVVTFDPISLRIIEVNSSATENLLDVLEIYSEWKAWLLAEPSRLGYPQAFSVVGGDPTIGSQSLGSTFFLENNWRIRPAEYVHKLTLSGNLFPRGGGSVFVPTLASINVHTETFVSNIIDTSTTAGTSPDDLASAVWSHIGATTMATKLAIVEKVLRNRSVTDPATGLMTVYDDDNVSVLFTAQIYEDVSGSQAYRGQGVNRRERFS